MGSKFDTALFFKTNSEFIFLISSKANNFVRALSISLIGMKLNLMTKFFSFNPGELFSIKFKIMASSSPIEEAISGYRPPVFWKEKDVLKKQIETWTYEQIENLIFKTNSIELLIKKNPTISTNIVTNFLLEQSS